MEKATFAGGCFWAVEDAFENVPGIISTRVGYAGGHVVDPTHEQVRTGTTGHAEAVEITFDPDEVSYDQLLDIFWHSHDPTQLNRQGPDVGTEYRSAIFYHSMAQHDAAERSRAVLMRMKHFRAPIMTEIIAASAFYPAEEKHQHFIAKERARGHHWSPPISESLGNDRSRAH